MARRCGLRVKFQLGLNRLMTTVFACIVPSFGFLKVAYWLENRKRYFERNFLHKLSASFIFYLHCVKFHCDKLIETKNNMLPEAEKQIIIEAARKYNVAAIYLFGSTLTEGAAARDIDLGVLDVPSGLFFDFYAELMKNLPKPVDLIDLKKPTLFNKLILRDGMKIYG